MYSVSNFWHTARFLCTNPELAEVKKTRVLEDFVYFYSVEQDLEISKNQVLNAQHWFGFISDHFLQQAQISQHLLSKKKLHPPLDEIDFRSCFYIHQRWF